MNRKIIAMAAALLPMMASGQSNTERLNLSNMSVNKGDSLITLNMTLNPKGYRLKGNDIVSLTPMLVSDGDTLKMPSLRVAGRNAWYSVIREGHATPLSLSRSGKGASVDYSYTLPFDPAMAMGTIIMQADTVSICNCDPPRSGDTPLALIDNTPITDTLDGIINFDYIAPTDSIDKVYDLSGRANIIFKVNKTDIDWTYLSNYAELDSIMKSINAVKDNEYATVEKILLTGYASPEGPYDNNVRLAKGRTEVVRQYVEKNSDFAHSVFDTASVPEDWAGLRKWIEESTIPNRDEMIAFIDDSSIPIEKKNDMFHTRFPKDYPFLLKNVYPFLRHTDYKITYRIKTFYDVDEIEKVFAKNPSILSLNELYLLSHKYEQGSDKYYNVMLTAAAMYPTSDVANLNAAGCSMMNGNTQAARMYLERVKPGKEADYAWGVLYALEKEYPKALELLKSAAAAGIQGAEDVIPLVEEAMKPNDREPVKLL